ncbi:hypothetical protein [Agathobaculum sp.]|uniref:hypothetical protein n=1 Tax=Agathobaculum sp. TaxID=2048138 RepID=UPI003AB8FA7A
MKRFEALTAERQNARQDYAAVRRNVEEFLSPPRRAPARQKDEALPLFFYCSVYHIVASILLRKSSR